VPPALEELRRRGWRLAILSNSDRDLIAASRQRIGVPFDRSIVAEDVHSYKPDHGHWEEFFARTEADRSRHVHVAASLFHDVAPAIELGLRSIWINRLGEDAGSYEPTRELPDLAELSQALEELVPA
jgi:2-haloacid dehalogenase